MSVATMKSDSQVKADVLHELKFDPTVDETEVGVQVGGGVVTLTGTVSTYPKKIAARDAAHRVHGVLDVVDEMHVRIPMLLQRSDQEVAAAVRTALKWDVTVPDELIKCTVSDGAVTLEGAVNTWTDRFCAERAVHRLTSVRSVVNRITVFPQSIEASKVKRQIEEALERQAEREAKRLNITVADGVVTITGTVRSWGEKNAAERVAWATPGVRRVDDKIAVDPYQ